MQSAEAFGKSVGMQAACAALIVPRSSVYRAREPQAVRSSPKISARALSQAEKIKVREELNSERFQDRSPREVYATLIDEGHYLCSWRSMYRILDENHEVRERPLRGFLKHCIGTTIQRHLGSALVGLLAAMLVKIDGAVFEIHLFPTKLQECRHPSAGGNGSIRDE